MASKIKIPKGAKPANPGPVPVNAMKGIGGLNPTPLAPAPLPPDPYLQNSILTANRNIGLGDAESTWQQGQLQRSSGFDANGNVITSGADFNPYSQAMQLQDNWHTAQRGTTNSLASQGQLYSGAMANAQGYNDKNYAQGFDALKTQTLGGYHGIQANRLGTYASNSIGTNSAGFDSIYKSVYGQ